MKKKLMTVMAVFGLVSAVMAQDVKLDPVPNTISVKPVVVRTLGNDANWRSGFAFPVMNLRDNKTRKFATLDAWMMTDMKDFRGLYLGAGLDFPIFERKHMRVGLNAGWSADFGNLEHVKEGRWSLGASITFRF